MFTNINKNLAFISLSFSLDTGMATVTKHSVLVTKALVEITRHLCLCCWFLGLSGGQTLVAEWKRKLFLSLHLEWKLTEKNYDIKNDSSTSGEESASVRCEWTSF